MLQLPALGVMLIAALFVFVLAAQAFGRRIGLSESERAERQLAEHRNTAPAAARACAPWRRGVRGGKGSLHAAGPSGCGKTTTLRSIAV